MLKPTIGLNCDLVLRTSRRRQKLELYREYTSAVELADGLPILLPVTDDPARIDEQLDLIDGLVLTGGDDYDSALYGATPHPKTVTLHPDRQFYDIELARAAIRRKIPVLAICGGLQLVNIVCGGRLIQHLPEDGRIAHNCPGQKAAHDVTVVPNTKLARILGRSSVTVNSTHHQAAERIGSGLRAAAHSADGVVEALESSGETFLVCIQWHPERLAAESAEQLALFAALVEAALSENEAA